MTQPARWLSNPANLEAEFEEYPWQRVTFSKARLAARSYPDITAEGCVGGQ